VGQRPGSGLLTEHARLEDWTLLKGPSLLSLGSMYVSNVRFEEMEAIVCGFGTKILNVKIIEVDASRRGFPSH